LTRKVLFDDATSWGANALVDESWSCDIFRRAKGTYEVRVSIPSCLFFQMLILYDARLYMKLVWSRHLSIPLELLWPFRRPEASPA
jgi:hypothetical protein